MCRLDSDLADLVQAALTGRLNEARTEWKPQTAVGVVLTAAGYPDAPRKGDAIGGLEEADSIGTTQNAAGDTVTNGGRVLCAVGLGEDAATAKARAYQAVGKIHFAGMQYRRDIADRAIGR